MQCLKNVYISWCFAKRKPNDFSEYVLIEMLSNNLHIHDKEFLKFKQVDINPQNSLQYNWR